MVNEGEYRIAFVLRKIILKYLSGSLFPYHERAQMVWGIVCCTVSTVRVYERERADRVE